MQRKKSVGTQVDRDLVQGEAEFEALESLLDQQFTEEATAWTALLNALVVEAELPRPRQEVVDGIVRALSSLRGHNEIVEGVLFQLVRPLMKALALPPRQQPPPQEVGRTYAFAPEMTHQVLLLRNFMGLSKFYIYRYLRYGLGNHVPSHELMQYISSLWSVEELSASVGALRK